MRTLRIINDSVSELISNFEGFVLCFLTKATLLTLSVVSSGLSEQCNTFFFRLENIVSFKMKCPLVEVEFFFF